MHDNQWFERQYDARGAVPEHTTIIARWAEDSRRVRLADPCYLDVAYGTTAAETLDVFPSHGASRALLVFIHGGYWRALDKSYCSFIARPFTRAGVTVAVANYALCPQVTLEIIVRQMLAAHAWLWRNAARFGTDPARIHTSGHSAGGHLAAMMAACDWPHHEPDLPPDLIRGALCLSGIYDVGPLRRTRLNDDLRLDANAAAVLSPLTYTPRRAVPVRTAVGGRESEEFQRQNRLVAERWPHCYVGDLSPAECNHFTIVDALADPGSALHRGALTMMGL